MPPIPPLNFNLSNPSAAWGGTMGGGNGWNQGTWSVNVAGSGVALQSGGLSPLLIALAVGAAWLLLKR